MKLVWSPETASKAYIDTIKSCKQSKESGEAELIAMAGGWKAKLIVEAWSENCPIAMSIGLAIAASHSGARHVCMLLDELSRLSYINAMQKSGLLTMPDVVVGEAEDLVVGFVGVDFLVVDGQRKDFSRVLSVAKLSHHGAVLVCKNASQRTLTGFRWSGVLGITTRVARSLVVPVGNGLDIAYIASNGGTRSPAKGPNRWIRHIDHRSGEEHMFRG